MEKNGALFGRSLIKKIERFLHGPFKKPQIYSGLKVEEVWARAFINQWIM